jgi:hypothetical protein
VTEGFGVIAEEDEPWHAKKVVGRIVYLKQRQSQLAQIKKRGDDCYRQAVEVFYSDLRRTWERLVEEILLNGVVERFCPDVKTQSPNGVYIDDGDHEKVYWAMKRASDWYHDMATGRNIPLPTLDELNNDLLTFEQYLGEVKSRKTDLEARRKRLERAPQAALV